MGVIVALLLTAMRLVSAGPSGDSGPDRTASTAGPCVRTTEVVPISFSATRYPTIHRHYERAVAAGWPRVLVLNRQRADERRERPPPAIPTRHDLDRDEYPPAVGRGTGRGLERGSHPRGWRASVQYAPAGENRSHGARLGIKLRRYCDGTRFRYLFY